MKSPAALISVVNGALSTLRLSMMPSTTADVVAADCCGTAMDAFDPLSAR